MSKMHVIVTLVSV